MAKIYNFLGSILGQNLARRYKVVYLPSQRDNIFSKVFTFSISIFTNEGFEHIIINFGVKCFMVSAKGIMVTVIGIHSTLTTRGVLCTRSG